MHLRALGGLELEGTRFGREKPLLLVTYLALEGPRPRRFLADLFWPEAADTMNSLSVALSKLRKLDIANGDDSRAWAAASVSCDAVVLREHLRAGRLDEGVGLYRGPLAEGFSEDIGEELEEWLLETREAIAREVRVAMLELAEREANAGRFAQAAARAEAAYRLPGAPLFEPEELPRLYRLLRAADHPACQEIEREARELGVSLETTTEAARGRLRQHLLGRKRELETLLSMEEGEWAWLRGGSGMGKTTLLREVAAKAGWRYVPGRSGLPFATLEPLVGSLEGGEGMVFRHLSKIEEDLLFDDWEAMDPESQRILLRLRATRPMVRVVLAGEGERPCPVEWTVNLGPLTKEELKEYEGVFEATDGLPSLVGAWAREEPVEVALESRLLALSPDARTLFIALDLLEEPDLVVIRKALGWEAKHFVAVLQMLTAAGLVEASGRVRARPSARAYMEARSSEAAFLALQMARVLPPLQAFPLYRRARAVWDEADFEGVGKAYREWANEVLQRGYPAQATEVLAEAPASQENRLAWARALERTGKFKQALEIAERLEPGYEELALRSTLYWRMGRIEEAKKAAEKAMGGSRRAKAEAQTSLGMAALYSREFTQAMTYFDRAGNSWLAAGEHIHWIEALINQGITRYNSGDRSPDIYKEALEAAEKHLPSKARVLMNIGVLIDHNGAWDEACLRFNEAAELALEVGALHTATLSVSNLGTVNYRQGKIREAQVLYRKALELAQEAGEERLIGAGMKRLAEASGDIEAWEEAINYLEKAGYEVDVHTFREDLEAFMKRSGMGVHS